MSVFHENMLIGSSGQGGAAAYSIERSVRLNSADSAYFSRTPGSAGNQAIFTFSCWIKRATLGSEQALFSAKYTTGYWTVIDFDSSDRLRFRNLWGTDTITYTTTQVFRDPSAWYHIVVAIDITKSSGADAVKMYVNGGSSISSFATSTYSNTFQVTAINYTYAHSIGRNQDTTSSYFNGYLADVVVIGAQQLTPSNFGETNATTGVWVPKEFTGTYGTNGFKLNFSNNSATTAATLGADTSGNGNNWTPNNFSVTAGAGNDSLRDSPTNGSQTDTGVGGEVVGNYATWNPLDMYSGMTLANGNLEATGVGTTWRSVKSTLAIPGSGKWYFELTPTHTDGVHGVGTAKEVNSNYCGATTEGWGFQSGGYYNSTYTAGASYSANDVLMVAIDRGTQKLWFGVNGTWVGSGNPGSGTNATFSNLPASDSLFPMASPNSSTKTVTLNAGQRAFAYTAPSGFKALCTANLPAPTIVKSADYFDSKLYTGNGTSQTVSGFNFSPDFVWIKRRDVAAAPVLADTVRGAGNILRSNGTDAELTGRTDIVDSFTSTGFVVGYDGLSNANTGTYVGWAWDSASSNATNTSGSIQSTVRANISAGFSVITYTGNGTSAQTIGHGLGVAPEFLIVKCRSHANDWIIYHKAMGDKWIQFDTGAANDAPATIWNDTAPTSTVFSVGTSSALNTNTRTYVAYAWAPVAGYSAFGSYTGNGSSDGVFVHTSMRPRWILLKRTDTTSNWTMIDAIREGYNVDNDPLFANLADVEGTTDLVDILSNGFKLRSTDASVNASSGTYVYACFAESPFQYARAR